MMAKAQLATISRALIKAEILQRRSAVYEVRSSSFYF